MPYMRAKSPTLKDPGLLPNERPESPGRPKKCKNVQICQNNITFHTDKALK